MYQSLPRPDRGLVEERLSGGPALVPRRAGAPGAGPGDAGGSPWASGWCRRRWLLAGLAGSASERCTGRARGDRARRPCSGADLLRDADPAALRTGVSARRRDGALHRRCAPRGGAGAGWSGGGGSIWRGASEGPGSAVALARVATSRLTARIRPPRSGPGIRPPSTRPVRSTLRRYSTLPMARASESVPSGWTLALTVCPPPRLKNGTASRGSGRARAGARPAPAARRRY